LGFFSASMGVIEFGLGLSRDEFGWLISSVCWERVRDTEYMYGINKSGLLSKRWLSL
jgi:hypothetical protein